MDLKEKAKLSAKQKMDQLKNNHIICFSTKCGRNVVNEDVMIYLSEIAFFESNSFPKNLWAKYGVDMLLLRQSEEKPGKDWFLWNPQKTMPFGTRQQSIAQAIWDNRITEIRDYTLRKCAKNISLGKLIYNEQLFGFKAIES